MIARFKIFANETRKRHMKSCHTSLRNSRFEVIVVKDLPATHSVQMHLFTTHVPLEPIVIF